MFAIILFAIFRRHMPRSMHYTEDEGVFFFRLLYSTAAPICKCFCAAKHKFSSMELRQLSAGALSKAERSPTDRGRQPITSPAATSFSIQLHPHLPILSSWLTRLYDPAESLSDRLFPPRVHLVFQSSFDVLKKTSCISLTYHITSTQILFTAMASHRYQQVGSKFFIALL